MTSEGLVLRDEDLRDICRADPLLTRAVGVSKLQRNRTWETLLAALVAGFSTPTREEPDVLRVTPRVGLSW
jgi:hypothetical protein